MVVRVQIPIGAQKSSSKIKGYPIYYEQPAKT